MEQHISEILQKNKVPLLTKQEILESYSHVVLTEDEIVDAMIWAKRKKIEEQKLIEYKKFQEDNRKLKQMKWDFDMIKTFMVNRAKKLFKGAFVLDESNETLFDLFCYYFILDEINFTINATKYGVKNPSLKKGLLIPGKFGCGKTWMMNLFSRNAKLSFEVLRAKDISQQYLTSKEKEIPEKYLRPFRNNIENYDVSYPSEEVFNQQHLGLCIDDLGSEDVKNNYGNKVNVIGDLIEARYLFGFTGLYLHGTTNMSAEQIKTFYGGRVVSRMREIFNFIELLGEDRRK